MEYFRDITNEELGAILKANHEKYLERVALLTPQWIHEGLKLKKIRKHLNITQKEISENVGVSSQVVAKLEKGKPVRSRKMLKQSYQTALKCIQLQRSKIINNAIDENTDD